MLKRCNCLNIGRALIRKNKIFFWIQPSEDFISKYKKTVLQKYLRKIGLNCQGSYFPIGNIQI